MTLGPNGPLRLGFAGVVMGFAAIIPAYIHSQTGTEASGWLYAAFAIFGLGFLVTLVGTIAAVLRTVEERSS
jgi:hypothetical protein